MRPVRRLRSSTSAARFRICSDRAIATHAVELSERDIHADPNGAWAKRSQLVARFKAERIAEGEAVAAHIEEIVDVNGYAQPSQVYPGANLAIEIVPLPDVERRADT